MGTDPGQTPTADRGDAFVLTPRSARRLVAALLAVKFAITLWDCVTFDGLPYDAARHAREAVSSGLELDGLSYDAPLYYLPVFPYVAMQSAQWRAAASGLDGEDEQAIAHRPGQPLTPGEQVLRVLRFGNALYIAAFYCIWILGVLPRAIADPKARTLAALLLLALPGYQKLAVMTHPDNLHVLLAALCMLLWLELPDRLVSDRGAARASLGLAIAAGVCGLTRPFAAATVATFTVANGARLWILSRPDLRLFLRRAAAVTLVTAGIASSWFLYRGIAGGRWRESYPRGYVSQFDRRHFDYLHYLSTFYLPELLSRPNRRIAELDAANFRKDEYVAGNRFANSFFTTLYSETWGDHWLYFSGGVGADRKVTAKRGILLAALPLLPLLAARMIGALAAVLRECARRGIEVVEDPAAVLALQFVTGAALYLWWQLGSGLLPGKQSSIKFIYSAYLYAPAVTLCFTTRVRRPNAWLALLLVVFVAALPVAVWVPRS